MELLYFLLSWVWIDEALNTDTVTDSFLSFFIFGLLVLSSPFFGVFFTAFFGYLLSSLSPDWVTPMSALFVGCVSKIVFLFISDLMPDIVNVMFICYAVDIDNNVKLDPEVAEVFAVIESVPGVLPVDLLADGGDADVEKGGNPPVVDSTEAKAEE